MYRGNPITEGGEYFDNGSCNAIGLHPQQLPLGQPMHDNFGFMQYGNAAQLMFYSPNYSHQQCHGQEIASALQYPLPPSQQALPITFENGGVNNLDPQDNIAPNNPVSRVNHPSAIINDNNQLSSASYTNPMDGGGQQLNYGTDTQQSQQASNPFYDGSNCTSTSSAISEDRFRISTIYAYLKNQSDFAEIGTMLRNANLNQQNSTINIEMSSNQQLSQQQETQTNFINGQAAIPLQSAQLEEVPLIENAADKNQQYRNMYEDFTPIASAEVTANSSVSQNDMDIVDSTSSAMNYQAENQSQGQIFNQEQQQNSLSSNRSDNVHPGIFEANSIANSSNGPMTNTTMNSMTESSLFDFDDMDEGSVSMQRAAEEVVRELSIEPNYTKDIAQNLHSSISGISGANPLPTSTSLLANLTINSMPESSLHHSCASRDINDGSVPTRISAEELQECATEPYTNEIEMDDPLMTELAMIELTMEHEKLKKWIDDQTKQSIGPQWKIDQQNELFYGIFDRCNELKTMVEDISHPKIKELLEWDYNNCIFLSQPNPWMKGETMKNTKGPINEITAKSKHTCYETQIFPFWHRIFGETDKVSLENEDCHVIALVNEDKGSRQQNSNKMKASPYKCEISKYMKCITDVQEADGIFMIKSQIISNGHRGKKPINKKTTETTANARKNKQCNPKTRGNNTRYCLRFNVRFGNSLKPQRTASFAVQNTKPNDENLLFKIYATRFFEKISRIHNYVALSKKKQLWSNVADFLELFAQNYLMGDAKIEPIPLPNLKKFLLEVVERNYFTIDEQNVKLHTLSKIPKQVENAKVNKSFIDTFLFMLNILKEDKTIVNKLWKSGLISFCDRDSALDMLEKVPLAMIVRFQQTYFGSMEILVSPGLIPIVKCYQYEKGFIGYVRLNQCSNLHDNKMKPIVPPFKEGTIFRLVQVDKEQSKNVKKRGRKWKKIPMPSAIKQIWGSNAEEKYVYVRTLSETPQYGYLKANLLLMIRYAKTIWPTYDSVLLNAKIMKRIHIVKNICGPNKITEKETLLGNADGKPEIKLNDTYFAGDSNYNCKK